MVYWLYVSLLKSTGSDTCVFLHKFSMCKPCITCAVIYTTLFTCIVHYHVGVTARLWHIDYVLDEEIFSIGWRHCWRSTLAFACAACTVYVPQAGMGSKNWMAVMQLFAIVYFGGRRWQTIGTSRATMLSRGLWLTLCRFYLLTTPFAGSTATSCARSVRKWGDLRSGSGDVRLKHF